MNKYYMLLQCILDTGDMQINKKGANKYLVNQVLTMGYSDLQRIFEDHPIAKKKLATELALYMDGEEETAKYSELGISWWDYCSPRLVNSYPSYYKDLPALIGKINKGLRPSKNYMFFIGANNVETNQQPCLSLMQFQIIKGKLWITVYQRSADSNLGLPSDIYQTYLISKYIDCELENITYFIGNAHIYENNIENTERLLSGSRVKFNLNV